jgi:hypothetical protein
MFLLLSLVLGMFEGALPGCEADPFNPAGLSQSVGKPPPTAEADEPGAIESAFLPRNPSFSNMLSN